MTDIPKTPFANSAPRTPPFDPGSRYYPVEIAELEFSDGTKARYVRRRFIGQPAEYEALTEHRVAQRDRVDNIATFYFGDPGQYWRICDANAVIRPEELTDTVGRRIRITLPQGIPGGRNV